MNRRIKQLYLCLLRLLPTQIGILARAKHYKPFFGNHTLIRQGVIITHPQNMKTGRNVNINHDTVIRARYGVTIGDHTMISWRVNILSQNHRHNPNGVPYRYQGYEGTPIKIGSNCWIGCNATILPGVEIGDNCVIGASSVITKNVPDNSVIVGVDRLVKTLTITKCPYCGGIEGVQLPVGWLCFRCDRFSHEKEEVERTASTVEEAKLRTSEK